MLNSTLYRWSGLGIVTVLAIGALWILNLLTPESAGWEPHAVSHLTAAVIGALATVGAVGLRGLQAAHFPRAGRLGPLMVVLGLAWFGISQMVKTLSAVIEYPNSGIIHTTSGLSTMLGLMVALAGCAVAVLTAITGMRTQRRTTALLLFSVLGMFGLYVFLGIVLGF